MSQQEVAGRAGLTRSSVANIETGRQAVLLHHFVALARALDCSPDILLPASDLPPEAASDVTPRRVELFVASLAVGKPRGKRARV
jgi:transcriptional regulator with XRE-family HTH domain